MNLMFFHSDGDIFCGRHYAEISKPRCGACDEVRIVWFALRFVLLEDIVLYVLVSEFCYSFNLFLLV